MAAVSTVHQLLPTFGDWVAAGVWVVVSGYLLVAVLHQRAVNRRRRARARRRYPLAMDTVGDRRPPRS